MLWKKILNWWKVFLINILSRIYSSLGWFRIKFYQWGIFRTRRLSVPVLCVGDLILGGSGKTPTVVSLATHFQEKGYRVAILCSGYKGRSKNKITVVSQGNGPLVGAEEGGDEAVMMARSLPGVVILSGKNRYNLGKYAVEKLGTNLVILDGGYQHLGLARDLNILLVTPELISTKTRLHQILREPISGIRRADLILVTKVRDPDGGRALKEWVTNVVPDLPVFHGELISEGVGGSQGEVFPEKILNGKRILALSGIGAANFFHQQLQEVGAILRDRISLADHYHYPPRAYQKICQRAEKVNAEIIVTTEKDFEKISRFHPSMTTPLYFLRIRMKFSPDQGEIFKLLDSQLSNLAKKLPETKAKILVPNMNRRFSGVTATIISVIPALGKYYPVLAVGNNLPPSIPKIAWREFLANYRKGPRKIWHARRNLEMVAGLILKTLGYPLILLWTSAAQRRHKWLTRFLYKRMDQVISTTQAAASFLECPSIIINHGIDTRRFHPPEDRFSLWKNMRGVGQYGIGIFGRVRPQKGTGDFVEVLCELLPSFPQWSGVIIGEITPKYRVFQAELQKKIEKAGLQDRLVFLGKLTDFQEVVEWYRAMSLVVVPPRIEGFGLTVPEAMASGCGVIATQTGAFSQIIESGKNGWLIPCSDRLALRESLQKVIKDPDQLTEMGKLARKRIKENFSIQKEAQNIAEVYQDLFNRFSKRQDKAYG